MKNVNDALNKLLGMGKAPSAEKAESKLAGLSNITEKSPRSDELKKLKKKIKKKQAERSKRARSIDRLYNAPLARSAEQWLENPSRYDFPHVDTIPKSVKRRRAQNALKRAKKKGLVRGVKENENLKGRTGEFRFSTRKIALDVTGNKERTLPHELGHAFDSAISDIHIDIGGGYIDEKHTFSSLVQGKEKKNRYKGVPLSNLKKLKGIGPKTIQELKKMGHRDVQDVYTALNVGGFLSSNVDRIPHKIRNRYRGPHGTLYNAIQKEITPMETKLRHEINSIMNWLRETDRLPNSWVNKNSEKIAEFIRSVIIQPRATKRRFPRLWKIAKKRGLLDAIGAKYK